MALPDNVESTIVRKADYLSPYDKFKTPLVDWERGGVAIADPDQGVDYQLWTLTYDGDEDSPNYGDFVLTPESFGDPVLVFNVAGVSNVALAFDQNCHIFIAYYLEDTDVVKYYWYDTLLTDYTTSTLPAGSTAPAACLDDHRDVQVRAGVTDIIMAYTRSGSVYYRQQRDRYATERKIGEGVGDAPVDRVGMTGNLRLKFDIQGGDLRLSEIVGDACIEAGFTGQQLELDELYPTEVRGYWLSQVMASSDVIRGLQRVYFFDMPEYDGALWGLMRGRDPVLSIPHDDIVVGEDVLVKTAREQELEFPRKMHLAYANAERSYTPTKQTSERLSSNVKVKSEVTVECFVNLEDEEAAQRAEILHKSAWAEFEGSFEFGLSEEYFELVPSDVVLLEVQPDVWKRCRIETIAWSHGALECKGKTDRKSAWASGNVAPTIIGPEVPASPLPGTTGWEYMDLPALVTAHDYLLYYVAGFGTKSAWTGFELQREVGTAYEQEADVSASSTLGFLEASVAAAPAEYKDVTNTITVSVNKPLYAATYDDLLLGKNAALLGDEIIQFQDVQDLGDGLYALTTILRGRLNTTPTSHAIGARFVLLVNPTIVPVDVGLLDETFNLRAVSYGTVASDAVPLAATFTGESQREWEPAHLAATLNGSNWDVSWWHRKRLGTPVNPIDSVNFEKYWNITFTKGATSVTKESTTESYTYLSADQSTDFGSAQTSWDDVSVVAVNRLTGDGHEASTGAVS